MRFCSRLVGFFLLNLTLWVSAQEDPQRSEPGHNTQSRAQDTNIAPALDPNLLMQGHCSACHSLSLVTSQRGDRDFWLKTIRWMQETQNLWDLGAHEKIIVDYLATHYAPSKKGRRQNLVNLEWYALETE